MYLCHVQHYKSSLLDMIFFTPFFIRFDNKYHLRLTQRMGKSGKGKEAHTTLTVENFFDETGRLLYGAVAKEVLRLHSDVENKKN